MAGAPRIGIGNTEVLNGAAAAPRGNQPVFDGWPSGGGGGYGGGGGGSTCPSDEQKRAG